MLTFQVDGDADGPEELTGHPPTECHDCLVVMDWNNLSHLP